MAATSHRASAASSPAVTIRPACADDLRRPGGQRRSSLEDDSRSSGRTTCAVAVRSTVGTWRSCDACAKRGPGCGGWTLRASISCWRWRCSRCSSSSWRCGRSATTASPRTCSGSWPLPGCSCAGAPRRRRSSWSSAPPACTSGCRRSTRTGSCRSSSCSSRPTRWAPISRAAGSWAAGSWRSASGGRSSGSPTRRGRPSATSSAVWRSSSGRRCSSGRPCAAAGAPPRRWRRRLAAPRRERARLAAEAVEAERNRVAGELHDVVAHALSAMVDPGLRGPPPGRRAIPRRVRRVRGRGAQRARRAGRDPRAARRAAPRGRRARARPAAQPRPRRVAPGPREGRRAVGRSCDVEGERRPLPAGADLTAFRAVQEALGEAIAPGGAGAAEVRIVFSPAAVELEVSDDGAGRRPAAAGHARARDAVRRRAARHGAAPRRSRGPGPAPGRRGGDMRRPRLPVGPVDSAIAVFLFCVGVARGRRHGGPARAAVGQCASAGRHLRSAGLAAAPAAGRGDGDPRRRRRSRPSW